MILNEVINYGEDLFVDYIVDYELEFGIRKVIGIYLTDKENGITIDVSPLLSLSYADDLARNLDSIDWQKNYKFKIYDYEHE